MHYRQAQETFTPTTLPDDAIRRVLGAVKSGPDAKAQAPYGAIALEADRGGDLRADLMRQRRETMDRLEQIEAALDELDALATLERVS